MLLLEILCLVGVGCTTNCDNLSSSSLGFFHRNTPLSCSSIFLFQHFWALHPTFSLSTFLFCFAYSSFFSLAFIFEIFLSLSLSLSLLMWPLPMLQFNHSFHYTSLSPGKSRKSFPSPFLSLSNSLLSLSFSYTIPHNSCSISILSFFSFLSGPGRFRLDTQTHKNLTWKTKSQNSRNCEG